MGILNNDPYPVPYSDEMYTATYIHTQIGDHVNIRKVSSDAYEMNTYFHVHISQSAYTNGKSSIGGIPVMITVSKNDIETKGIYTLFYDQLKIQFPNYTDLQPDLTEDP